MTEGQSDKAGGASETARPFKKVLRITIAYIILAAILIAPFFLFQLDSRTAWIIGSLVYIIVPGVILLAIRTGGQGGIFDLPGPRDELLLFLSTKYKRLIYPQNYKSTPPEFVDDVVRVRFQPTSEILSVRSIVSKTLQALAIASVAGVFVSFGIIQLYYSIVGPAPDPLVAGTTAVDRLLRGAIWDFFEAYHISFIDPPETSWAFQTIDFLIRTTMSVFVFVGLAWGFVLWKYRRQYKKEMRILYTKYLFIDALRRQVHDWAQTIPQQVGDERDVRSRFDRVVLPRLWSDEGPQTDLDFHEYKAAYEQRKAEIQAKGEPLSDLLDVDVPLMEDWKLSDKQKDAIAAARGPIDPP